MTDEIVTDAPEPEAEETQPEETSPATETPTEDEPAKEAKDDVDPDSLTDVEKEFYKPGMSLSDVRKSVADAFRTARTQTPGLTREDFEEMLDQRLQSLRQEPEEVPEAVREIEATMQRRVSEYQRNGSEISRIEKEFNGLQTKVLRLEGQIAATDDPDRKASLERDLDRATLSLNKARSDYGSLRARNEQLEDEYKTLEKQRTRAQHEAQQEREEQAQKAAERAERTRQYNQQFSEGYTSLAKTEIPEELRDRVFKFVEGIAVVDLKNRPDRSRTDVAALAKHYAKELVGIHKEWAKLDAKRGTLTAPGRSPQTVTTSRAASTPKPAQQPKNQWGIDGMRPVPSKAEAAADWEQTQARARQLIR